MCSLSTGTGAQTSDWRSTMLVPPVVAARDHVGAVAEAVDDDARARSSACRATASSAWCLRPTFLPRRQPPSAVIRTFAPQSLIRPDERLRGEPAEHDRVRRADPRAGEHRDRQLGDHRHVDRDPVALRRRPSSRSAFAAFELSRMQVGVGQRPGVAGLADPVVGDLVAEARLDVAVDAVVGDVELAVREPLREREVPLERRRGRRRPGQPLARLARPRTPT